MQPILAPNGRPARRELAFNGVSEPKAYGNALFATPRSTGTSDHYRQRNTINFGGNLEYQINGWQFMELRSASRQLFAQVAILFGAIQQKAMYAVGDAWQPQYYGSNKKWGQQVEEWLTESFFPVADARGSGGDFTTALHLYSLALDFDGDEAMILTESPSGFPQLYFLPADRIFGDAAEITDGPFKGSALKHGCILNRDGRVIGYRVKTGQNNAEFQDFSTANCMLGFEPIFTGQRRGLPKVAPALLDWFDVQDINAFLKRGVKLDASQGVIHYTESGHGDTSSTEVGDNDDTDATDTDLRIESREGGEIRYMRAGIGEKIESFASERPHPNTEAFIERLERSGMRAIEWYLELTDPSALGGASVRLIQDGARATVRNRQRTLRKRFKRAVSYAVAKGMKSGFIPKNDADWWMFEPQLPGVLTVDEGYSRAADIDDLARGLTTKSRITAKNGGWWEDTDAQRDREFTAYLERCQAHHSAHPEIPLSWILEHLEMSSPNPPPFIQDTAPASVQKPAKMP